jgi:hypothetical protein
MRSRKRSVAKAAGATTGIASVAEPAAPASVLMRMAGLGPSMPAGGFAPQPQLEAGTVTSAAAAMGSSAAFQRATMTAPIAEAPNAVAVYSTAYSAPIRLHSSAIATGLISGDAMRKATSGAVGTPASRIPFTIGTVEHVQKGVTAPSAVASGTFEYADPPPSQRWIRSGVSRSTTR